jgi:hypothetical protein
MLPSPLVVVIHFAPAYEDGLLSDASADLARKARIATLKLDRWNAFPHKFA